MAGARIQAGSVASPGEARRRRRRRRRAGGGQLLWLNEQSVGSGSLATRAFVSRLFTQPITVELMLVNTRVFDGMREPP